MAVADFTYVKRQYQSSPILDGLEDRYDEANIEMARNDEIVAQVAEKRTQQQDNLATVANMEGLQSEYLLQNAFDGDNEAAQEQMFDFQIKQRQKVNYGDIDQEIAKKLPRGVVALTDQYGKALLNLETVQQSRGEVRPMVTQHMIDEVPRTKAALIKGFIESTGGSVQQAEDYIERQFHDAQQTYMGRFVEGQKEAYADAFSAPEGAGVLGKTWAAMVGTGKFLWAGALGAFSPIEGAIEANIAFTNSFNENNKKFFSENPEQQERARRLDILTEKGANRTSEENQEFDDLDREVKQQYIKWAKANIRGVGESLEKFGTTVANRLTGQPNEREAVKFAEGITDDPAKQQALAMGLEIATDPTLVLGLPFSALKAYKAGKEVFSVQAITQVRGFGTFIKEMLTGIEQPIGHTQAAAQASRYSDYTAASVNLQQQAEKVASKSVRTGSAAPVSETPKILPRDIGGTPEPTVTSNIPGETPDFKSLQNRLHGSILGGPMGHNTQHLDRNLTKLKDMYGIEVPNTAAAKVDLYNSIKRRLHAKSFEPADYMKDGAYWEDGGAGFAKMADPLDPVQAKISQIKYGLAHYDFNDPDVLDTAEAFIRDVNDNPAPTRVERALADAMTTKVQTWKEKTVTDHGGKASMVPSTAPEFARIVDSGRVVKALDDIHAQPDVILDPNMTTPGRRGKDNTYLNPNLTIEQFLDGSYGKTASGALKKAGYDPTLFKENIRTAKEAQLFVALHEAVHKRAGDYERWATLAPFHQQQEKVSREMWAMYQAMDEYTMITGKPLRAYPEHNLAVTDFIKFDADGLPVLTMDTMTPYRATRKGGSFALDYGARKMDFAGIRVYLEELKTHYARMAATKGPHELVGPAPSPKELLELAEIYNFRPKEAKTYTGANLQNYLKGLKQLMAQNTGIDPNDIPALNAAASDMINTWRALKVEVKQTKGTTVEPNTRLLMMFFRADATKRLNGLEHAEFSTQSINRAAAHSRGMMENVRLSGTQSGAEQTSSRMSREIDISRETPVKDEEMASGNVGGGSRDFDFDDTGEKAWLTKKKQRNQGAGGEGEGALKSPTSLEEGGEGMGLSPTTESSRWESPIGIPTRMPSLAGTPESRRIGRLVNATGADPSVSMYDHRSGALNVFYLKGEGIEDIIRIVGGSSKVDPKAIANSMNEHFMGQIKSIASSVLTPEATPDNTLLFYRSVGLSKALDDVARTGKVSESTKSYLDNFDLAKGSEGATVDEAIVAGLDSAQIRFGDILTRTQNKQRIHDARVADAFTKITNPQNQRQFVNDLTRALGNEKYLKGRKRWNEIASMLKNMIEDC